MLFGTQRRSWLLRLPCGRARRWLRRTIVAALLNDLPLLEQAREMVDQDVLPALKTRYAGQIEDAAGEDMDLIG